MCLAEGLIYNKHQEREGGRKEKMEGGLEGKRVGGREEAMEGKKKGREGGWEGGREEEGIKFPYLLYSPSHWSLRTD